MGWCLIDTYAYFCEAYDKGILIVTLDFPLKFTSILLKRLLPCCWETRNVRNLTKKHNHLVEVPILEVSYFKCN